MWDLRGERPSVVVLEGHQEVVVSASFSPDGTLPAFGFDVALDRASISGGDAWKHRLWVLIRDADSVVFVLSPSSRREDPTPAPYCQLTP